MKPLSESQQALADELARILEQEAQPELRAMADTLAGCDEHQLFGPTEFRIRDLTLRIARKAYDARLRQKKRLPRQ